MKFILISFIFTNLLFAFTCNFKVKPYEILSCGEGKNFKEAKKEALNELAAILNGIHIKSAYKSEKYYDKNFNLNNIEENINIDINSKIYGGYKLIKKIRKGDRYFIALSYDNSPFMKKFQRLIRNDETCKKNKQKDFIKNSPLFKKLNYNINISFKNGYSLYCGNTYLRIKDISDFYYNYKEDIKLNKNIFKNYEEINISINNKKLNYLNLLIIDGDGKVGVILKNKLSKKNFQYKNTKFKLIAKTNKKISKEMLVLIKSKEKISINFENINDKTLDQSNYSFDKLIELLDGREYSLLTFKIKD